MYRGSGKKALENFDEDDQVEDYDEDITDESEEFLESVKFNYIMTYRNNGVRGKKLPEHIVLKNPIPGEASVMQKRRSPIALRFHQVKRNIDPERYFYGEVLLYYPQRKEIDLLEATEM